MGLMSRDLLRDVDAPGAGPARLGGKGAGLAELVAAGVHVPAFLVITAGPFRRHLHRGRIPASIGQAELRLAETGTDTGDPRVQAALERISTTLTAAVGSVSLETHLGEALRSTLPVLGPGPFAVRSSMVGEDSARHSFAGQLDSFLCLPTLAEVLEAVIACWASAFGVRALAYRRSAGYGVAGTEMAVVVQHMVEADRSGVLFTANPLTGVRDEHLVTAAWGLGQGIVSGECDTDEYVWHPVDGERRVTVADKSEAVVARPGGGTATEMVAAEARHDRCLSREKVQQICHVGEEIASRAGRPMDIEWAFENGQLWVLQARPITSLPPVVGDRAPTVWDNSNIQESYNGVTLPLSFSFAARAYRRVYRTFARTAGVRPERLDQMEPALRNMVSLIDGRVYYNLNNWYRLISLFPGFAKSKEDMEKMMGVEEPVDFVTDRTSRAGAGRLRPPCLGLERGSGLGPLLRAVHRYRGRGAGGRRAGHAQPAAARAAPAAPGAGRT